MRTFSFCLLFIAGCAIQKPATTSQSRYTEDLSALRPQLDESDSALSVTQMTRKTQYVEARNAINEDLDNVLDSINRIYLSQKYIDGFTIQVYSGLDREAALDARKQLTTVLPELASEIQYSQPNFRVRAGNYFNRLDAQKDFVSIKRYFPNAIITPSRIALKGNE
jgi:type II secretory pathway component HofQ